MQTDASDDRRVQQAVARLNARAWGISTGLLLGLGLFVATIFLVVKGGPNVGQHLQLIRVFFPGYSVTWFGSVVGFVYAFVVGYALGRLIGATYNRITSAGNAGA